MAHRKILSVDSPFDWTTPQDAIPSDSVVMDIPPESYPPGWELRLAVFLLRDAYDRLATRDRMLEYEGAGVTRIFHIPFYSKPFRALCISEVHFFRPDWYSHAHLQTVGLEIWYLWPGENVAEAFVVFKKQGGDHWLLARKLVAGERTILQVIPLVRKEMPATVPQPAAFGRPAL